MNKQFLKRLAEAGFRVEVVQVTGAATFFARVVDGLGREVLASAGEARQDPLTAVFDLFDEMRGKTHTLGLGGVELDIPSCADSLVDWCEKVILFRALEKFDSDKATHASLSFGYASTADDTVSDMLTTLVRALKLSFRKEFDDKGLPFDDLRWVRLQQEAADLGRKADAGEIDQGDLFADILGIGLALVSVGFRNLQLYELNEKEVLGE